MIDTRTDRQPTNQTDSQLIRQTENQTNGQNNRIQIEKYITIRTKYGKAIGLKTIK